MPDLYHSNWESRRDYDEGVRLAKEEAFEAMLKALVLAEEALFTFVCVSPDDTDHGCEALDAARDAIDKAKALESK